MGQEEEDAGVHIPDTQCDTQRRSRAFIPEKVLLLLFRTTAEDAIHATNVDLSLKKIPPNQQFFHMPKMDHIGLFIRTGYCKARIANQPSDITTDTALHLCHTYARPPKCNELDLFLLIRLITPALPTQL